MYQIVERRRTLGRTALAFVPLVVFVALMVSAGCTPKDDHTGQGLEQIEAKLDAIEAKLDTPTTDCPIPPDNSKSQFTPGASEATRKLLTETARALSCTHPLGCTCFLDGIQTACGFVLGCIDAGFCECVSGCENIG